MSHVFYHDSGEVHVESIPEPDCKYLENNGPYRCTIIPNDVLLPTEVIEKDEKAGLTQKQLWIADVSVKILASCPYPYMSVDGHRFISAAEYAATQARTMADKIFD